MKTKMLAATALTLFAVMPARATETQPVIIKVHHYDMEVDRQHHAVMTMHVQLQATNDAAAADIGEQAVPFSETLQTLEIVEAYTLKADGEKISVAADAIHTQQRQGTPQQPLFDDLRQKVIVFPHLSGGDSVVFTARWVQKEQYIPGQIAFMDYFQPEWLIEDGGTTIMAPKDFPLYVETHGLDFKQEEKGDSIIYRWHYSNSQTGPTKTTALVNRFEHMPRLYASSLKSYDELGRAYAELALPKTEVTDAIQTLAERLTEGISDRRAQAEKLYAWVSKNIRYVGLEFGASAIIPRAADAVLALGYGDCKDHSVLFSALLKAKGIESDIVLINSADSYTLSQVPSVRQFDHVIVYLPEFDMYADTTAGVAPFGTLPFDEYGKPVVHAVKSGAVVRRTPVLGKDGATATLKNSARIDEHGDIYGELTLSTSGPFSISARDIALDIQRTGQTRYAQGRLERVAASGHAKFDFASPSELGPDYTISSTYAFQPHNEWLSGRAGTMFRGILPAPAAGDFMMGPAFDASLDGTDATACYSGRVVEELSLKAPPGREFGKLPDDAAIKTAHLEFTARWSREGSQIAVRREFVSEIAEPLCSGELRAETAKALKQIRSYYTKSLISLEPEGGK